MSIYCTYLTIYSGNKLPPFYIGFVTIKRIEQENYHGSITSKQYRTIYVNELKENPHLFKTVILTKHQDKNTAIEKERYFQTKLNVLKNSLYMNRTIGNIKFSPKKGTPKTEEHKRKVSQNWIGRKHSIQSKEKIRQTKLGKKASNYTKSKMSLKKLGVNNHFFGKSHSEETKLKMKQAWGKRKLNLHS